MPPLEPPPEKESPEEKYKRQVGELIDALEAKDREELRRLSRRQELPVEGTGDGYAEWIRASAEKSLKELGDKPYQSTREARQITRLPLGGAVAEGQALANIMRQRAADKKRIEDYAAQKPYPSQSTWESILDAATIAAETPSGRVIGRPFDASPEEKEAIGTSLTVGTGAAAGAQWGMKASKALPHPLAKAAAPIAGMIAGGTLGYFAQGRAPTKGEMVELGGYGLGLRTVLKHASLMGLPLAKRMLVGATESAGLGYMARKSRQAIDGGEDLPFKHHWQQLLIEAGMGAALGGFAPKILATGKGPSYRLYTKKNEEVISAYNDAISLLQRQLGGTKRGSGQGKYGSKYLTPQDRQEGMSALAKLKSDKQLIKENPEYLFRVKDPALTARMLFLIRQRNPVRFSKKGMMVDKNAAFMNSVGYLNSLGTGKFEQALKLAMGKSDLAVWDIKNETYGLQVPKLFPKTGKLNQPETWENFLRETLAVLESPESLSDATGKAMGVTHGANFKRLYWGIADVLKEAARKSGEGKDSWGNHAAAALRNAVDDGGGNAGRLRGMLLGRAKELNYGAWLPAQRKRDKIAREQFSEYQRLRHSNYGGKRGVGLEDVRGTGEKGHVPLKKGEPIHVTEGTVSESVRIAKARKFYETATPEAKALIDGWNEASEQVGRWMKELEVVVLGPKGTARLANTDMKYWPVRLLERYEDALMNPDKKITSGKKKGQLMYAEELKEMREAYGVDSNKALLHKFNDYLKVKESGDPSRAATGELFSHMERMKVSEDVPHQLLDWSFNLGENYLSLAGHRAAEIGNFGNRFLVGAAKKDKSGKVIEGRRAVRNPDYLFSRGRAQMDDSTSQYVDSAETAIFGVQNSLYEKVNRMTTAMFIANEFSAIKNLTGVFKTWLIAGNKSMTKAFAYQAAEDLGTIADMVRGKEALRPNTKLANLIGVTSEDIASIVHMMDAKEASALGKGGVDVVGGMLKYMLFSPAEKAIRRHGLEVFQLERADFLKLYDSTPDAENLVRLYWKRNLYAKGTEKYDRFDEAINRLTGGPVGKGTGERLTSRWRGDLPPLEREGQYGLGTPSADRVARNKELAIHIRFLTGMGIDMNTIAGERFGMVMGRPTKLAMRPETHPETVRYFQRSVRWAQGGYKYDQLPVFMTDPRNKILLKFFSWQQQMTRLFERNVLAEANEGNFRPIFKFLAGAGLAGEGIGEVSSWFGRDRTDASWREINAVFNEGEYGQLAKMLLVRYAHNIMLGGQWNAFYDATVRNEIRRSQTGQSDEFTFPVYDAVKDIAKAVDRRAFQDGDNKQFALDMTKLVSGVRRTGQLLTRAGAFGDRHQEWQEYENIERKMKGLSRRWVEAHPLHGGRGEQRAASPSGFALPKHHAFKRDLRMALVLGDAEGAKKLAHEHILDRIDTEKRIAGSYEELWKELEPHVRYSQPLKMGSFWSKENQDSMIAFMKRRDFPDEKKLMFYQNQYIKTAREANLLPPEEKPTRVEEKKAKATRRNSIIKAYAEAFYRNNKSRMPPDQLVDKAQLRYDVGAGGSKARGIGGEEGKEEEFMQRIGSKRGWPYDEEANKTLFGRDYSLRTLNAIKAYAALELRDKRLSAILLDPEYINIGDAEGRASYIQEEWDSMGLSQGQRDYFIQYMVRHNFFDGEQLPAGHPMKQKYLKTLEDFLHMQKMKEELERERKLKKK